MDAGYALLRLVHVFSAVFWVGSTAVMIGFIQPALQASGMDGAKFMQNLLKGRLPVAMNVSALLTIVAGAMLYYRDSAGFQAKAWLATAPAGAWGTGGLIGILALLSGIVALVIGRQLGGLTAAIQATGGPPTSEQRGRLDALQSRVRLVSTINLVLLVIALIFMVIARAL
jgi:uncharacterized membrane protein